jgi:inosine/xanthosine triphosphatase
MKIAVGSKNRGKIEAVENALNKHDQFSKTEIIGVDVSSGVTSQPIGLEDIIKGAKNRALASFEKLNADLGIGLESGIFLVPETKSEYMDITACAIYDGKQFHLGMSSCFEYPQAMINKVLKEGKEISDAAVELGFFENKDERENMGMIGLLTQGVVTRKEYSEQAVHMALVHLLNQDHY